MRTKRQLPGFDVEKKPRCPLCRKGGAVTRHSINTRADGATITRWLCRECKKTFLRRKEYRQVHRDRGW